MDFYKTIFLVRMKIAPNTLKAILLLGSLFLYLSMDYDRTIIDCENDFTNPTIDFPAFPGLVSGDTMFLVCSSMVVGFIENEAVVEDNCDPNPLVNFSEQCEVLPDCTQAFKYFAEYNWTIVDNNNNVTEFSLYTAIGDKTPPVIEFNGAEGVESGDTITMECGFDEVFDESYVTVTDSCDPSTFCDDAISELDVFFQERILEQGDCEDNLSKMRCTWTATDGCGNESKFELIVLLTDETPPEFIDVPDFFCGTTSLTVSEYEAYKLELDDINVNDRCSDHDLFYTIEEVNSDCTFFIQWTAVDDCGNTSLHQQNVCITDAVCNGIVSGTVRLDTDEDFVGDEPIAEVQLLLIEDIDGDGEVMGGEQVFKSTTTDEMGFYSFEDVPQGCYVIVELQPNGVIDARDEDVTNPGNLDPDGTNHPVDNLIPVCVNAGEFDDGNDFLEQQIILAIELSGFSGEYLSENNAVKIDWQTSYEYRSEHFLIERSTDGTSFEAIGQIETSGSKSVGDRYSFIDQELTRHNQHFYRLVEVDADGAHNKSEIISVRTIQNGPEIEVFPNPSTGHANILLRDVDQNEELRVELFDLSGQSIKREIQYGDSFKIGLTDLAPGTYLLRIHAKTQSYVRRIIHLVP